MTDASDNRMDGQRARAVLHLPEPWFVLGVLTEEQAIQLAAACLQSDDQHPEHYRWWAFTDFLREHRPLPTALASALYSLGEHDPDVQMGGSMMTTIVKLDECPAEVLAAAVASGRPHLVALAVRKRAHAHKHDTPPEA